MSAPALIWARADLPAEEIERLAGAGLTAAERDRARRYVRSEDRARFVVGRTTLRRALAERCDVAPADVPLRLGRRGKPHPPAPWRCSVAHSGTHAVVALTTHGHVGVDVERVDELRDHARLARAAMTAAERHALDACDSALRARLFTALWTAKEAYVKATGIGLGLALREVEVTLRDGVPVALSSVRGDRAPARRWTLSALDGPAGYEAALVWTASGGPLRVRCANSRSRGGNTSE